MKDVTINRENFIPHKTTAISKEYTLGKQLGTGAFGSVRLAVHKATKQTRAVKILKKTKENVKNILDEIHVLSTLSHPNIMQIFEVFEDQTNYYIVSERCKGGELFDVISEKGSFTEKDAATVMKQLLSGVCYSHQNHIVHRDLKPENILMDNKSNDLTIKIIDWGCAQKIKKDERLHSADGTAYYVAPEVLKGDYDEKCDVWSCGVIMYILLCGYPPFNGDNDDEIYEAVLQGEFEYPEAEWDNVSKEAKALIKKMLTLDTKKRVSALDAMSDKWFNLNKEELKEDEKVAKNVISNMKRFKKNKKLEQATVGFIINQLVSKEERNELAKQFKDWDKNGDGVLSKEEIIGGYKKAYGKVDEVEIDNMIKSVDLDGNGVIDYNEFLSCALNKEKIINEQNLELCFKAFDLDGSGTISLDELTYIFKKGDKSNNDVEAFKKILAEADENGDGEISFSEFKDIMSKFFS